MPQAGRKVGTDGVGDGGWIMVKIRKEASFSGCGGGKVSVYSVIVGAPYLSGKATRGPVGYLLAQFPLLAVYTEVHLV